MFHDGLLFWSVRGWAVVWPKVIGMGIAAVVEKLCKVLFGCADESSGKRGSFHKVTRGMRKRRRPVRHPQQELTGSIQPKQGEFPWHWVS
jgi:hypothetical protein